MRLAWDRFLALVCLALASPAQAADGGASITVEVERNRGAVEVDTRVLLPVSPRVVWEVLTDYDHIATFVPGLSMSRLISGAGEPLLLEQRGELRFPVLSVQVNVVARVEEHPYHTIRFQAVRGNMAEMSGEWSVETIGADEGSSLRYRLHVVPEFWVPPVLGPALIRRSFHDQFEALVREMMRRASR